MGALRTILVLLPAFIVGHMTITAYADLAPDIQEFWELTETNAAWIVGGYMLAFLPALALGFKAVGRSPKLAMLIALAACAIARLGFAYVADGFAVGFFLELLDGAAGAIVFLATWHLIGSQRAYRSVMIAVAAVIAVTISVVAPRLLVYAAFVIPEAWLGPFYAGGYLAALFLVLCGLFVKLGQTRA